MSFLCLDRKSKYTSRNFRSLLNHIKTNDICVRSKIYLYGEVVSFYSRTKKRNDMPCINILFKRKIDIEIWSVFYIYDNLFLLVEICCIYYFFYCFLLFFLLFFIIFFIIFLFFYYFLLFFYYFLLFFYYFFIIFKIL